MKAALSSNSRLKSSSKRIHRRTVRTINQPPPAEPPPESTSTLREAIPYVNDGLGTGAEVFDHYSCGSLVDKPEPYTFVEPGMYGIRTEIYPMATADLPGATPAGW